MGLSSNKAINTITSFMRSMDTVAARAVGRTGYKMARSNLLKGTRFAEDGKEILKHRKAIGRAGIAGMGLVSAYRLGKD